MAKFSILIPMYNSEKYIAECVSSIIKQSFCDYECIIVDDGSRDMSVELARKCIGNDSRFFIYRQTNMGVAKSREKLLSKATGEYIIWIDSDDYVVPKLLATINSYINEYQPDALIFKYSVLQDSQIIDINPFLEDMRFSKLDIIRELAKEINMPGFLWNKVFKRAFYSENLFKGNLKMLEDYYIMPDLFLKCNTIIYINSPLYIYRQDESSIG